MTCSLHLQTQAAAYLCLVHIGLSTSILLFLLQKMTTQWTGLRCTLYTAAALRQMLLEHLTFPFEGRSGQQGVRLCTLLNTGASACFVSPRSLEGLALAGVVYIENVEQRRCQLKFSLARRLSKTGPETQCTQGQAANSSFNEVPHSGFVEYLIDLFLKLCWQFGNHAKWHDVARRLQCSSQGVSNGFVRDADLIQTAGLRRSDCLT